MLASIKRDLYAAYERDPAARNRLEVILLYPGFHAIVLYRVAHLLWIRDQRMAARIISAIARFWTNVDIHPGAQLGDGLFIDHASGVVVGETAECGIDVTIYHGVTLGGRGTDVGKRHPTLGDRVTVGAGAKILGPVYIGSDSRIGANAVVVKEVPPNSVVIGIPGQVVERSRDQARVHKPDLDGTVMPDVLGAGLHSLQERVDELEASVIGHIHAGAIRSSESGTWRGEDFSI
ncbi:MAG: serine O-acetyltransferase [Acidimicrobiaceae bacterium]|nr:serine O-acetyltransferase [Acidimicrobiaceae bacterium]